MPDAPRSAAQPGSVAAELHTAVQPVYSVTFTESGLPSGKTWWVTLNGSLESSTNTVIAFTEPNGSYAYRVTDLPGWHEASLPYAGTVTVAGSAVVEPTLAFSPTVYAVSFSESGLPIGTSWSASLAGAVHATTSDTILFNVTNGSRPYTVVDVPSWHQSTIPYSGSIVVAGGPVTEPTLAFSRVLYAVTFSETGLPAGGSWNVSLNGTLNATTGSSLGFQAPNGSVPFVVGPPAGYAATPPSGRLVVAGAPLAEAVTIATGYALTFSETGLPSGTSWGFRLGAVTGTSTGSSIVFEVPNGTFGFVVEGVRGFAPSPRSGSTTVNGSAALVSVTFSTAYLVTVNQTGLPFGKPWSLVLGGTVLNSTNGSIGYVEPNGSYAYTIDDVAGWHQSTLPYSGTIAVAGAPVTEPTIVFAAVTYALTFAESGLPPGTNWSVKVAGVGENTTTAGLSFSEPNGTFVFRLKDVSGYHESTLPYVGSVVVSGGAVAEPTLSFSRVVNPVAFRELGLPIGSTWSASVGASPAVQSNTTVSNPAAPTQSMGRVVFTEPNGTLPFSFTAPAGFGVSRVLGGGLPTFTGGNVSGARTFVVRFGPIETLTFSESGLPTGSLWGVAVVPSFVRGGPPGQNATSTGASIAFQVVADPWTFHVTTKPSLYVTGAHHGHVGVRGAPVTRTLLFRLVTEKVEFRALSLPSGHGWGVNITGPTNLSLRSSTAAIVAFLENGTYSFTVWNFSSFHPHPASGSFTVVAPGPVQFHNITFGPFPAPAIPTLDPFTFVHVGGSGSVPLGSAILGRWP